MDPLKIMFRLRLALFSSVSCLALTYPLGVQAQELSGGESPEESFVDEIHEDWSAWVLKTADNVDGFFSNAQADENAQKTRIRAWLMGQYDGNEGTKFRLRVRARISLPRTENRLSLVLGDDEEERRMDQLDDSQSNVSLQIRSKKDTALKQLRFDVGIRRRDSRYQPYVRARHTKVFDGGTVWLPRLTNSFYYFTKSKFEYRGELQFDRVFGPNLFFRPLSVLRWYGNNTDECNDGWCFDQFFSLYQRINSKRQAALAYDVELYFRNQPSLTVFDTVFKVRYRQMTSKEWLFWEVEPAVHFPYDYGSDPTFRILAKLEGVFGYNTKVDINDYFTPTEAQWGSKKKPTD